MKCIPIGIAGKMRPEDFMRPSDFSDRQFDGIQLRKAVNGETVLIMRSRKPMPLNWKVVFGYSSVFFATFEEAECFCRKHGMSFVSGEPGYER